MDNTTPNWLPETYLWGGKPYGLTAFAAAIERKVKEEGGQAGEEDVIAKAQRIQHSLAAAQARENLRSSVEAVQTAQAERKAINARLAELVSNLSASNPGLLQGQDIKGLYTVWTGNIAITFYWNGQTINSIQGDKLTLLMSKGSRMFSWKDEVTREVAEFELEPAEDDVTWRWVEIGNGLLYSSIELADDAVRRLMDEHERKAALQRQRLS